MSGNAPRPPRGGDHAAAYYRDADELIASLAPYVSTGIVAGDLVLWVAHDLSPQEVRDRLAEAGVAVEPAITRGVLSIVSARDAFLVDERFNVEAALTNFGRALAQAQAAGFARIRAVVEMTYLLIDAPGIERAPEFERRTNDEIFARFPFLCVCAMNQGRMTPAARAAVASHPLIYQHGLVSANPERTDEPTPLRSNIPG